MSEGRGRRIMGRPRQIELDQMMKKGYRRLKEEVQRRKKWWQEPEEEDSLHMCVWNVLPCIPIVIKYKLRSWGNCYI